MEATGKKGVDRVANLRLYKNQSLLSFGRKHRKIVRLRQEEDEMGGFRVLRLPSTLGTVLRKS